MNYAQKSFLAEKKKTSVDMDDENANVHSSDGFWRGKTQQYL